MWRGYTWYNDNLNPYEKDSKKCNTYNKYGTIPKGFPSHLHWEFGVSRSLKRLKGKKARGHIYPRVLIKIDEWRKAEVIYLLTNLLVYVCNLYSPHKSTKDLSQTKKQCCIVHDPLLWDQTLCRDLVKIGHRNFSCPVRGHREGMGTAMLGVVWQHFFITTPLGLSLEEVPVSHEWHTASPLTSGLYGAAKTFKNK